MYYFYIVNYDGYKVSISVWKSEMKSPEYIGRDTYDTRSFYGEQYCAKQIISRVENIKMEDSYNFVDKSIKVYIVD